MNGVKSCVCFVIRWFSVSLLFNMFVVALAQQCCHISVFFWIIYHVINIGQVSWFAKPRYRVLRHHNDVIRSRDVIGHVTIRLSMDVVDRNKTDISLSFHDVMADVIVLGSTIHYGPYTGWSKKTVPQFYFCDNFRKWTPILTIFSPLEQAIHAA